MNVTTKKILIVGVGSIGLRHLRCFQSTGRAELSFCEVNPALRAKVAKEQKIERHYADLESALADPHDAAVICTPANLHIPMAIRLAEAGIHLLLEKPLSTSLDGIDKLQQILESRKLKSVGRLRDAKQSDLAGDERRHRLGAIRPARARSFRFPGSIFPRIGRRTARFTTRTTPPAAGRFKTP